MMSILVKFMREIDQELFEAAKEGNLNLVIGCISKGADVHQRIIPPLIKNLYILLQLKAIQMS